MYVAVLATFCTLASPVTCEKVRVTDSDAQPLTMHDCFAVDKLADFMGKHPRYGHGWRVAEFSCVMGRKVVGGSPA